MRDSLCDIHCSIQISPEFFAVSRRGHYNPTPEPRRHRCNLIAVGFWLESSEITIAIAAIWSESSKITAVNAMTTGAAILLDFDHNLVKILAQFHSPAPSIAPEVMAALASGILSNFDWNSIEF